MTRSLGLSLPNRGVLFGATSVDEMYSLTERAERSGYFGSVWVGDGLIAKPRLEATEMLSALAARTEKVRLGVCCMATFPLRNPVLFAIQWASLDVISSGRSLLAVCLGVPTGRGGNNFDAELRAMGISGKERVRRMEQGIELVRRLWSEPTASDSEFWQFPEIDVVPKPVQQPCPIWIASNPDPAKLSTDRYEAAIERVARLADGWQSTVVAPEEFGRRLREIRQTATDLGRDPSALTSSVHLMINLQNDQKTARFEAKRFLDEYYSTDTKPEVMNVWGAYGTPEQVRSRIQQYLAQGLDVPILRFASFDQKGQMDRALEELIPDIAAA
jgi:alkanesulfonate monooxygenase SsuD/methylene tetrahydromethanopterin reductase-like flavin-dependent oxidoreductase (luciferase family)